MLIFGGPAGATVSSVNEQTGDVVLDAADVGAVPTTRKIIDGSGLTIDRTDLAGDPTLSVVWGAGHTQVPRGDEVAYVAEGDAFTFPISQYQIYAGSAAPNKVITGPFTSLWHDLLAFNNRGYTRTFETSTDGVTFVSGGNLDTIEEADLFSHKDSTGHQVTSTTRKAVRFTWQDISWSQGRWLVIAHAWSDPAPTKRVLLQSSADGVTWTTRHDSQYQDTSVPVWHSVSDYGGDTRLRLTITQVADGTDIHLSSIRLLTSRWGDQGGGHEYSLPYIWDVNKRIGVGFPPSASGNLTYPLNVSGAAGMDSVRLWGSDGIARELASHGNDGVLSWDGRTVALQSDLASKADASVVGVGVFGAVPREVYDLVVTSGSAVVTSPTANFTSDDVGKAIRGNYIVFGATIASVQSSTQATMSANAVGSFSTNNTTIGDLTLAVPPGTRAARPAPGHLFAAIGDSIAPQLAPPGANWGGAFGSSGGQDSLSYAHLLSDGQILQGQRAGIGSQRIEMMLPRLYQDIIPYAPHFCMIQTGTNDVSFGHSPATWAGYITQMCNILLAAGITPVLATMPPVPSPYRTLADPYRRFVTAYAARQGFPLVDAYGALCDPAGSGGYNPAFDSGDSTHPNEAGQKAYGQAIVDALSAFMAPGKPSLQATNDATLGASSASLIYNGLFLNDSNSDGIPDGWEKSGTSTTSTCSIVTGDTDIVGNALRLTDTGTGSTYIETSNVMGYVPDGHRWAFSGRVKVAGDSNCRLIAYTASKYPGEPIILNWANDANATNGWKRFYVEGVNDTGFQRMATLELSSSSGGSNVDISIAQVGFWDLTAAGL